MIAAPVKVTASTADAIEIELRPWEYSLAAQVGAERTAQNFQRADAAHYDRGRMEDDRTANHAAAAAELATARIMDRNWNACGAWSPDRHAEFRDLPDVGKNIEVRRIRDADSTTFAMGEKDRRRILVACYVVPPELRIVRYLGWIDGETAFAMATPAGYGDRVRVPISALTLRGVEG